MRQFCERPRRSALHLRRRRCKHANQGRHRSCFSYHNSNYFVALRQRRNGACRDSTQLRRALIFGISGRLYEYVRQQGNTPGFLDGHLNIW